MNNFSSRESSYLLQLTSIVGSVPFGIVTVSDLYKVDIINGFAVELLGFNKSIKPHDLIDADYNYVLENIPALLSAFETNIVEGNKRDFIVENQSINGVSLYIKCQAMQKGALFIIENVTEQRSLLNDLKFKASHDDLTKLINRQEFVDRLDRFLIKAKFHRLSGAIIFIDLDRFKTVNDISGHAAGDELLVRVAGVFSSLIRERDTVARMGGDEFIILLEDCPVEMAKQITEQIRSEIESMTFFLGGHAFNMSISAGIAVISEQFKSASELINAADTACHYSKSNGRNQINVVLHDQAELALYANQVSWLEEINKALKTNAFELYAQKIFPVCAKKASNRFEILIRLNISGVIHGPAEFLPTAERYDMMGQIDRWVLDSAFSQIVAGETYSINLSGQTISDPTLAVFIDQLQEKYSVQACQIIFEITETAAMHSITKTIECLNYLKSKGYRFALDDFGVGLSSFSYLKDLSVDYVKIDGSFVRDIVSNEISYAMVKAIADVAHTMGIKTIAEYIENQEILNQLEEIGIDYGQGYHVHRPELLHGSETNLKALPLA